MCFSVVFVPDSTTFTTNPRVVELVTGLVPVEQPDNQTKPNMLKSDLLTCIKHAFNQINKNTTVRVYIIAIPSMVENKANPKEA